MTRLLKMAMMMAAVLMSIGTAMAQGTDKLPAFPGAEGFGRYATGGRGGVVRHVTNLNDSGTGSLRAALNGTAKKIIVFDVSGTIHLKSALNITDNTTIAGQSAPGDGICVADYPCAIKGNNIIVRYMRFRLGNKHVTENGADGWDGFGALDKNNIIIDHCSVSWSIDECLSMSGCKDITVQWCLVSQSLVNSGHSKGAHGYGGNWGGAGSSYHHNLLVHHGSRVPRLGPRPTTQLDERMDMRNNVMFNGGGNGCYGGEAMKVNIVNNYYKPGPGTKSGRYQYRIAAPGIRTTEYVTNSPAYADAWHIWGKYYVTGNVNPNYPELSASDDNQWRMGIHEQIDAEGNDGTYTAVTQDTIRISEPIPYVAVTTHTAEQAYEKVLKYVGASLHRDSYDALMISDTEKGVASYTGSGNGAGYINSQDDNKPAGAGSDWSAWPTLNSTTAPTDTDGDGIPDEWEDAHGLNKNDNSDATKAAEGTWYTNIEVYLNSLVDAITTDQNAGGMLMGETLPGESVPVSYTLSGQTYQGSSGTTWKFANDVSMTASTTYKSNDGEYMQITNNKTYTINLPEGVKITSISFSGFCTATSPKTSFLSTLNGASVGSNNYTFVNQSKNQINTYDIAFDTPVEGKITFVTASNPTAMKIALTGIKEGSGIEFTPEDNPGDNPETGENVDYEISPSTHGADWEFGDVSISISGKDYAEGHVSSDFTGIKFSRNTNYTINLPADITITSVEVKGYCNNDNGTAYVQTLGSNTFDASEHTYGSKVTSSHTFTLANPAKNTMVFRPSGDDQIVATLKLTGTKGSTGIKTIFSDVVRMDGRIYTLQGVPVTTPAQKGIYIQNGKKIIIK